MKGTSKLQSSALALSILAVIAAFAYLSFAAPFYAETSNTTSPASPATYSPSANYSFAINWTNITNGKPAPAESSAAVFANGTRFDGVSL